MALKASASPYLRALQLLSVLVRASGWFECWLRLMNLAGKLKRSIAAEQDGTPRLLRWAVAGPLPWHVNGISSKHSWAISGGHGAKLGPSGSLNSFALLPTPSALCFSGSSTVCTMGSGRSSVPTVCCKVHSWYLANCMMWWISLQCSEEGFREQQVCRVLFSTKSRVSRGSQFYV